MSNTANLFDGDSFGGTLERDKARAEQAQAEARAKRAAWQEQVARDGGFAPPPTWFDLGTPLVDIGQDNLRQLQRRHRNEPDLVSGALKVKAQIESENRLDVSVPKSELRLTPEGKLYTLKGAEKGKPPLFLEQRCFRQLVSRLETPRGAATYLAGIPADRRAVEFNHLAQEQDSDPVVIRTRNGESARRGFAACSESYTGFEADIAAGVLAHALQGYDAKLSASYDGYRFQLDALFATNTLPEDFGVGEFTRAGIRLWSADDLSQSLNLAAMVERAICINLTRACAEAEVCKFRHVGDVEGLIEKAKAAVIEQFGRIKGFAEAWTAGKQEVIEKVDSEFFTDLVTKRKVRVPGVKVQDMRDILFSAWTQEPERTKAGVVNAITRAAHEVTWPSPWATQELENKASDLVYVRLAN